MIGNQADANKIARWMHSFDWSSSDQLERVSQQEGMTGWEYLGAGIARCAFLSPDGVVYKVAYYGCYQSKEEVAFFQRYSSHEWAVECSQYHVARTEDSPSNLAWTVNAMPFVPLGPEEMGTRNYWEVNVDRLVRDGYSAEEIGHFRDLGIVAPGHVLAQLLDIAEYCTDLHEDNVRMTHDGVVKLVDGG